jgi:hypothetical protein
VDVLGYVLADDFPPVFGQAGARGVVFPPLVVEELG